MTTSGGGGARGSLPNFPLTFGTQTQTQTKAQTQKQKKNSLPWLRNTNYLHGTDSNRECKLVVAKNEFQP